MLEPALKPVTIQLPQLLVNRIQRFAERQQRSIADALDVIVEQSESPLSVEEEAEQGVAMYAGLPDDILLILVQHPLPQANKAELDILNDKAQRTNALDQEELLRHSFLLDAYDKAVLRRAYCLDILHQRGYNLSDLLSLSTVSSL